MRPNVLLLVFDTARADAFEPYGAADGASPALAQLARRGSARPDVFAPASWTIPSHGSMFTGLLPRSSGISFVTHGRPEEYGDIVRGHADRLLPEVLRRAGHATAGVSANGWVGELSGFSTGFETWTQVLHSRRGGVDGSVASRAQWALDGVRARTDDGAREVERLLGEWVADRHRRPFFWFVNLIECHSPYLPPRPYDDLPPWQRALAADEARRHLNLGEIWRACLGGFDVPEPTVARMRHLYAACIRQLDDWLARVLGSLDDHGLLEETLVVVTSDHGENLGEGRLIGHAFSLDDRLLRVPFVAAGPGAPASGGVTSLTDLPAMVADAVGLEDHPWHGEGIPAGVAVAQLDTPTGPEHPGAVEARATWDLDDEGFRRLTTSFSAATDGRVKLLRGGGREELVDLAADPLETAPVLLGGHRELPWADRLPPLRRALDLADEAAGPALAPVPSAEGRDPSPGSERAALEEQLRLLGYL